MRRHHSPNFAARKMTVLDSLVRTVINASSWLLVYSLMCLHFRDDVIEYSRSQTHRLTVIDSYSLIVVLSHIFAVHSFPY